MRQAVETIKRIEKVAKAVFWSLSLTIVLCSSFYVYLVNGTIHNGVELERVTQEITNMNSKLADLEYQFLSAKSEITVDVAKNRGFVSAEQKTAFVTRETFKAVANR